MVELNPTITRWQGVGLMASALLGTGVFILPQLTVNEVGTWALWSWALLVAAVFPLGWVLAVLGRDLMTAWRLLGKKHRPAIVLGLLACAVFFYCLGPSMIYGCLLVVVLFFWSQRFHRKVA